MADKLQEGKFSGTTNRQKGIAIAVVVVILILIWQVIGIFSDNKPTPPPSKTPATKAAAAQASSSAPTTPAPVVSDELARAKLVNEPSFIKMQKATEEKYVVKLNELEELRIQRQIAETNQAISAAKLATVTAEKNISELLTKPAMPVIPQTAYTEQLVSPVTSSAPSIPPPPLTTPIADYTLISVSMQLRKWTAVVGYQGKLITVNVGDSLPDNSTIVSINKNSIIIRKDGETKRISIVSSI